VLSVICLDYMNNFCICGFVP